LNEFVKLIGQIGENADKLGALGLLLLVNFAFLYALNKDKLVTGNRWRDEITLHKDCREALKTANTELSAMKEALLRLQIEKEMIWSKETPRQHRARRVE
jgi:hypothetical protein